LSARPAIRFAALVRRSASSARDWAGQMLVVPASDWVAQSAGSWRVRDAAAVVVGVWARPAARGARPVQFAAHSERVQLVARARPLAPRLARAAQGLRASRPRPTRSRLPVTSSTPARTAALQSAHARSTMRGSSPRVALAGAGHADRV
jgi:hypothetical protein